MTDTIEATKEVATATAEVARTTGKAIDGAREAGRFFDKVMGGLVTDGFGLISDRLKYFRFERAVLLAHKTQRRLAKQGITNIRVVPPKVALPLIESATIEDNDDLHTLWANLLASAMDGDGQTIERKYVSVLADMSSEDAHTLALMYGEWQTSKERETREKAKKSKGSGVTYGPSVSSGDAISIATLHRLGLVTPSYVEFETYEPQSRNSIMEHGDWGASRERVRVVGDLECVALTEFGEAFCEAVMIKSNDP